MALIYQEKVTNEHHDLMMAFVVLRVAYRKDLITKEAFQQKCQELLTSAFDKYQDITFTKD